MSAILDATKALGPDGVRRYRTRWKILIQSHQNSSVVNVSDKVISISTSKNIKSVGNLSLSLTAEKNIFNLIYPNDYINVYCDRGDGQGWTRVFFGFVDNIAEMRRVDTNTGTPSTLYSLQCSDFQKAFERTNLYFNPFLAARADFDGDFTATPNIGGAALRTRGLRVTGSPADLVTSSTLLLLGFGTQFILPSSYNPRQLDRLRAQRADFILGQLGEDIKRQVLQLGGYQGFLDQLKNRLSIDEDVTDIIVEDPTSAEGISRSERRRFSSAATRALSPGGDIATESNRNATERGIEAYNVLNTTVQGYPPTLLDIVDILTFVEREAIDGTTTEMSIWERQDSVWSLLTSLSNEIVNELFLDLRPVSRGGGLVAGTDYSRDLDDTGENAADDDVNEAGILYQPALIMREYPFATIDKIDASEVPLTIRDSGVPGANALPTTDQNATIGNVYFGAIFSDRPNEPGRHVVTIPSTNINSSAFGNPSRRGTKHLDVAVVYEREILESQLSRSDTDHFNLFELVSESSINGATSRNYMMDLLPLVTPIHIVRHGLRKRVLSTRFARASLNTVNLTTPVNVTTPAAAAAATENAAAVAAVPSPPALGTPVLPVDLVSGASGFTQGYVTAANQWWYRSKPFNGTRHVNNVPQNPVPANGVPYWRFHNGVDIAGTRGTPVKAVADGEVVLAAPVGTRGRQGYGNIVVVYHPSKDLYSVYAHLDTIAAPFVITSRSNRLATFASARITRGGKYRPVTVRAGDVIGTMGSTDCEGVHLHFEINRVKNGRMFPSGTDRDRGITPDIFKNAADATAAGPRFRSSTSRPETPNERSTISQNPVRVLREAFGLTLPVGRDIIDSALPDADVDPAATFPGEEAEDYNVPELPVTPTPASSTPDPAAAPSLPRSTGHIDHASTRRLLARWTLLQDHWYQHNLEYISGSITMRGAPEIRAGYRLDLPDRNSSYYVEGVSHNWTYGQPMTTTLHVTRGQPNNPYPVYVLPALRGFNATPTQRKVASRLGTFFIIPDPPSVKKSIKLQRNAQQLTDVSDAASRSSPLINEVDTSGNADSVRARYNETVVESVMGSADLTFEEQLQAIQADLDSALANALPILDAALTELFDGANAPLANTTTGLATNPAASSEASNLASEFNFLTSPRGVR